VDKQLICLYQPWENKGLCKYGDLVRHESTALLLRTETVMLNAHLFDLKMGNVKSPACTCGAERQSAMLMLIDCPELDHRRHELLQPHPALRALLARSSGSGSSSRLVVMDDRELTHEVRKCFFFDEPQKTAQWALANFPVDGFATGRRRVEKEKEREAANVANGQAWAEAKGVSDRSVSLSIRSAGAESVPSRRSPRADTLLPCLVHHCDARR
jgi:hypothetical protein